MTEPIGKKTAIITGGGGEIGEAIALRLARRGVALLIVDKNIDAAERVARRLNEIPGSRAVPFAADIVEPAAAVSVMDEADRLWHRLDYLINAAGISRRAELGQMQVADWDITLDANLRAPALLSQEAIRFWKRQNSGAVVNIGSRVWRSGAGLAYTASKAGLVGLTQALAVQLGQFNVTVNAVAPSYLKTAFNFARPPEEQKRIDDGYIRITPLRRLGTVEDVAAAVAFLVSDDANYITGEVLHVCGGSQLAAMP